MIATVPLGCCFPDWIKATFFVNGPFCLQKESLSANCTCKLYSLLELNILFMQHLIRFKINVQALVLWDQASMCVSEDRGGRNSTQTVMNVTYYIIKIIISIINYINNLWAVFLHLQFKIIDFKMYNIKTAFFFYTKHSKKLEQCAAGQG